MAVAKEEHQARVDVLVERMRRETGVSRAFLDRARPALQKLYEDVPPSRRDECIKLVFLAAQTQASTEQATRRAKRALEQLEQAHVAQNEALEQLQERIKKAVSTAERTLASYYLANKQTPPIEA